MIPISKMEVSLIALISLNASRWTLFLADWFGKKSYRDEGDCIITLSEYKGRVYFINYKEKPKEKNE